MSIDEPSFWKAIGGLATAGALATASLWAWARGTFKRHYEYFQRKADECDDEKAKLWEAMKENYGAQNRLENCPAGDGCPAQGGRARRLPKIPA